MDTKAAASQLLGQVSGSGSSSGREAAEGQLTVTCQRIRPLTIGELWALAIPLRIVPAEDLRRLADQTIAGRTTCADADALTNRLLVSGDTRVRDVFRPIG